MHWIITRDKLSEDGIGIEPDRTGLRSGEAPANKDDPVFTHEFHLFDDDGILYYEGKCQNPEEFDEEEAFGPLDWAANDSGCTLMKYRKIGDTEWHIL